MKKPNPKPKTKRKTTYSRRKFIGNCAAGASLLHIAPLISFPSCTTKNPPFQLLKEKKYHALDPKWIGRPEQPTAPRISNSFTDNFVETDIYFPGFFSFDKSLKIKDSISPLGRNNVFHYVSMENMGWINHNGQPELPYMALLYHIPKFLEFELQKDLPQYCPNDDQNGDPKLYHEFPHLMVYPTQAESFDNVGSTKNYRKVADYDESVYGLDMKAPENVVEEGESFDFGYSRLVLVKIRPLLFNPKYKNPTTGEVGPMIFGYSNVKIRFKLDKKAGIRDEYRLETPYLPTGLDPLPRHERIIDPWYCPEKVNAIFPEFSGNEISDYEQFGPDLLIIHPKNFYSGRNFGPQNDTDPVTDLKDHKKKNGFPFAESTPYSQIENTIKLIRKKRTAIEDNELIPWPRLRHVILFGDVNDIPAYNLNRILAVEHSQDRFFYSRFHPLPSTSNDRLEKKISSDFYNGTLINRDLQNDIVLSDISIGRIPYKTMYEANLVVNNIIEYDKLKSDIRKNVTLVSYFQDIGPGSRDVDGEASTDYLQTMEIIREKLKQGNNISTIYQSQTKLSSHPKLKFRDGTNVGVNIAFLSTKDSKEKILETFNRGGEFIVHRDHGYMDGWSRPNFKIPDFWKIEEMDANDYSKRKPSIVFNINCLSGHFAGETSLKLPQPNNDCFSETLLLGPELPDGTKINIKCPAVIAAVDESPTFHNDWLIKAIFDGIYGGIISRKPEEMAKPEKVRLGNVLNLAKMLMFTSMEEISLNMYENEIYHIIGDPTLLV